jgi:hypothetical protein
MRLAVTLALLVGLVLPTAAGAAAKVPFGFFGLTIDGPLFREDVDQDGEFLDMTKVGAEAVSVEVNWNVIQPQADVPPDFTRIDRVVRNAARRGMKIMATPLYAPAWAGVDSTSAASPPDPGAYAGFLRQLILRFGPGGSFWTENPNLKPSPIRDWQIWNEPPSEGFWSLQPFQKRYVELLRYARFAIKGTDPGARVVLAGLTWRSWGDLGKIYAAGGKGLFDVVSLHPYTERPANVKYIVKLVRRKMARNGDGRMPVLITELSWPSAKGKTEDNYGYEVTPRGQAARLKAVLPMLAEARKRLRIERVYWHSWLSKDQGPFTFDYGGLRRIRGTTITDKPALAAYRKGVLALEGCRRKGTTAARCG